MQEKQKKWMLRIALYLVGIIVLALGITLNTKTNLGVSPIISMPYAVAQIFGYETGTAVFVAYLIFIVLQIVLLKGKFRPFQLLQVAASYLTSAFITIFDRVLPVPEQMGRASCPCPCYHPDGNRRCCHRRCQHCPKSGGRTGKSSR